MALESLDDIPVVGKPSVSLAARPQPFLAPTMMVDSSILGQSGNGTAEEDDSDSMSIEVAAPSIDIDEKWDVKATTSDLYGYRPSHTLQDRTNSVEGAAVFGNDDTTGGLDQGENRFGKMAPVFAVFRDDVPGDLERDPLEDCLPANSTAKMTLKITPIKSLPKPPAIPMVVSDVPVEVSSFPIGAPTLLCSVEGNTASKLTRHKHWSEEEDEQLRQAVQLEADLGQKNDWKKIAKTYFGNTRSGTQCKVRWKNHLKPGIKRGRWEPHEDETILFMVSQDKKWAEIAHRLPGRIGENVRERYVNFLDPGLKKSPWTEEEDEILFKAHAEFGNRWSTIRKFIPGRAENSIKNRYHNRKNAYQRKLKRDAEEMEMRAAGMDVPWDASTVAL